MKSKTKLLWEDLPFWTKLCILCSNPVPWQRINIIIRIISLLQLLSLILANIGDSRGLESSLKVIMTIKDFFGLVKFANIFDSSSFTFGVFIIAITYLSSYIVIGLPWAWFHIKTHRNQTSVKTPSILLSFHTEVLFHPICIFLVELFNKSINKEFAGFGLNERVVQGTAIAFLGINVLITLFKIFFCYCSVLTKRFLSRKSSSHLLGIMILKLILILLQSFDEDEKVIKIVLSFVFCLLLQCKIQTIFPEYDIVLNKLQIFSDALAVGISSFQLLYLAFGNNSRLIKVAILIVPFYVKISLNYFNNKVKKLLFHPRFHGNTNFMIFASCIYKEIKKNITITHLDGLVKVIQGSWASNNIFNLSKNECSHISLEKKRFKEENRQKLKECYETFIERKGNNVQLVLSYSNFIVKYFQMYSKGYFHLKRIQKMCWRFSDKIALYNLALEIKESSEKQREKKLKAEAFSTDLWAKMLQNEKYEKFKSYLGVYSKLSIDFWKIFQNEEKDMMKLYEKSEKILQSQTKLSNYWDKNILNLTSNNPISFLLYGITKIIFMNQPHEGRKYLEKYETMVKNKMLLNTTIKLDQDKSTNILISGEKATLGTVLDCSEWIFKLCGIERINLIGRNIKIIMPLYFQEKHDQLLMKYYETGQTRMINNDYVLYVKDQENHVVPVSILVYTLPDFKNGIILAGLIKKIPYDNETILIRKNGVIEEYTANVGALLNIEPYSGINIVELAPEFTNFQDFLQAFKSESSLSQVENEIKSPIKELARSNNVTYLTQEKISMVFKPLPQKIPSPGRNRNKLQVCETLLHHMKYEGEDFYVLDAWFAQCILPQKKKKTTIIQSIQRKTNFNIIKQENTKTPKNSLRKTKTLKKNDPEFLGTPLSSDRTPLNKTQTTDMETIFFEKESSTVTTSRMEINVETVETFKYSQQQEVSMIDNLQQAFAKKRPDRSRKVLTMLLIFMFGVALGIAGAGHGVLKSSIEEISVTQGVLRTSYGRLDALAWVWRFVLLYNSQLMNFSQITDADLDRFKVVIAYYANEMKNTNNALMHTITNSNKERQSFFYQENIRFNFTHSNEGFNTMVLNNFAAYSLLIGEISKFLVKPYETLDLGNNPEIDVILVNSVNDLLVASEATVDYFNSYFMEVVDEKKSFIMIIIIIQIITTLTIIAAIFFNLKLITEKNNRLFLALATIDLKETSFILSKFTYFETILTEKKEEFIIKGLNNLYNVSIEEEKKSHFAKYQPFSKHLRTKNIFFMKLRQTMIVCSLLLCFIAISFVRSTTSSSLFNDLTTTTTQLTVASKARYDWNIVMGSAMSLCMFQNTSTMRNEPIKRQVFINLERISSNQFLINNYVDPKTGKFIDRRIEKLFSNEICSYISEIPGGRAHINCARATLNGTINFFAVNTNYYEKLLYISSQILLDLSLGSTKLWFNQLRSVVSPYFNTAMGAFTTLVDIMSERFDEQIYNASNSENIRFILGFVTMLLLVLVIVWVFVQKVNDDKVIGNLLQVIPHEVVMKNKLLKAVIMFLYQGQANFLKKF